MKEQDRLASQKIDELLRFLPAFEQPDRKFIKKWEQYHPVYAADVTQFVRLVSNAWWMDTGYRPDEARQMLADDAFIQSANLEQIKTMLTCFVRGERFSDGHWGRLLENGRVQALLHRLHAILQEYQE